MHREETALETISRECGQNIFDKLVQTFPGRTVFVPLKPPKRGVLVAHFSAAELAALCQAVGGETVLVPVGSRSAIAKMRAEVRALTLEGRSVNDTVALAGCSRTTVFNVRAELRASGQLPNRPCAG